MTTKPKLLYKEGEIVIVTHNDNPDLPTNHYIGYLRENFYEDFTRILLVNIKLGLSDFNSRTGFRKLELRVNSQEDITRLVRGEIIKKPNLTELYEVNCFDPDYGPEAPEENVGLGFSLVGCYAGIRPTGGHEYLAFSNVYETDPEKLKAGTKDTTYGRRVFNRVRQNSHLIIKQLVRT